MILLCFCLWLQYSTAKQLAISMIEPGITIQIEYQQQQQQPSLLFPSKLGSARDETT
jgi:hypothetical protein